MNSEISNGTKVRVGVLRGGPSSEYEISLKSGGAVLQNLGEKYHTHDILISKEGEWHFQGRVMMPHDIVKHLDVIVNALHGEYGEDGTVQYFLDTFGVSYTGSRSLPSAVGMNKALSKKVFASHNIKTPLHLVIDDEGQNLHELAVSIFKSFPIPAVVKPSSGGSSVGVSIARTLPELEKALKRAFEYDTKVIVEEFIGGKEATCIVIDGFRGHGLYALLPAEIIPHGKGFFDHDAKHNGAAEKKCPGSFTSEESRIMQETAEAVHKALGLRHYSRTDFIVHPKRGIYVLEVNTLLGLTEESLLVLSLKAVGSSLGEFLEHVVGLAMGKK